MEPRGGTLLHHIGLRKSALALSQLHARVVATALSLKQRSAGAQIIRRLLSYCSSLSTSAKFFTRLYALDKDGSRRRRTVRHSTGSGAPIGYAASTAATRPFALTASQACEPG